MTDATNYAFNLSEDERRILDAIQENPKITQIQLHDMTGITVGTVKRILPGLQEKGVLKRLGNRRSGSWKIISCHQFSREN